MKKTTLKKLTMILSLAIFLIAGTAGAFETSKCLQKLVKAGDCAKAVASRSL